MLSGLSLAAVLVWATLSAHTTGQACLCSALLPAGLQVNCSSLNLVDLPHLPPDTTELHVQDNQLTSVSPGLFDRLVGLKNVSLSGNPFHCDCRIQYLRNWLLRNRAVVSKEPTCVSPSSVAQRAVAELSDDYFSSCAPAGCTGGTYYNTMMGVMLCCLIVLLLWSLRLAKMSTFTLYIHERHSGFNADSLRSLRPKHRRRLHTAVRGRRRFSHLDRKSTSQHGVTATSTGCVAQEAQYKDKGYLRDLLQWNYKNTPSGK